MTATLDSIPAAVELFSLDELATQGLAPDRQVGHTCVPCPSGSGLGVILRVDSEASIWVRWSDGVVTPEPWAHVASTGRWIRSAIKEHSMTNDTTPPIEGTGAARRLVLTDLVRQLEELRNTVRVFLLAEIPVRGVTRINGSAACKAMELFSSSLLDELIDDRQQAEYREQLARDLPPSWREPPEEESPC